MLVPWKESYDKPRQCIKKERHHFANKDLYSQSYGFSGSHVQMWGLDHEEGWVQKNWCFQIVVLEKSKFLALQRSNQSILKEINPEDSLEGLMLKLNLQYFGHLIQRASSLEKTLVLGKIEGRRRKGWQRTRLLDGITDSMDKSLSKLRRWWRIGKPGVLQSMGLQRVGCDWATELNWGPPMLPKMT